MRIKQVGQFHLWVVTDDNMVQLYELTGNRLIAIGNPERWSNELIEDLLKDGE